MRHSIVLVLFLLMPITAAAKLDVCSAGLPIPEYFSPETIFISEAEKPGFAQLFVEKLLSVKLQNKLSIAFMGSDEQFKKLKSLVGEKSVLHLSQVSRDTYSWQQDRFEVFAGSKGERSLRFVSMYAPETKDRNAIVEYAQKNGVKLGANIENSGGVKALAGGNIDTLPGGIALIGTSDFDGKKAVDDFIRHIGGQPDRSVVAETAWMRLGHIDEIARPLRSPKSAETCHQHILVSSTRLGIELLKKKPDGIFYSGKVPATDQESYLTSVCRDASVGKNAKSCERIKNSDILKLLKSTNLGAINEAIEKDLDRLADDLRKVKTSCRIDVARVPALYSATMKEKIETGSGGAIFPSFTNGLSIENNYFAPLTKNSQFDEAAKSILEKLGIEFVGIELDSIFDYGSPSTGYLHCAVQTLRRCTQ